MVQYVTNPQPFSSPLNLLYKGVFSTRINSKTDSLYGHYLNKLYRVQFLGIGTYQATIVHDIIKAVLLRHTSIDNSAEWFKITPNRYNESVVLEALGGIPRERSAGKQNFADLVIFANGVNKVKLADGLGLLTSDLVRVAEVMDDIRATTGIDSGSIMGGENLVNRIDALSEAGLLNVVDLKRKLLESDVPKLDDYVRVNKQVDDTRFYTVADSIKVNIAEKLVEVIANNLLVSDNVLLLTNMDVVARLVRKADVLAESLYLVEKLGRQSLQEAIPELAKLTSRQVSLLHYLLFDESKEYKDRVKAVVSEYIDSLAVSRDFMLESLESVSREVLEQSKIDDSFIVAQSYKDAVLNDASLQFSDAVERTVEILKDKFKKAVKPIEYARIDFEHELRAEDSKSIMGLLNLLYQDFVEYSKNAEINRLHDGGSSIKRDALVVEHLLGNSFTGNSVVIDESNYFGKINSRLAQDYIEEVIAEQSVLANTEVNEEVISNKLVINDTELHEDLKFNKVITKQGSIKKEDAHGEIWSETTTYVSDGREAELFGELTSPDTVLVPDYGHELISAELTSPEQVLSVYRETEIFGELADKPQTLVSDRDIELWGELTSEDEVVTVVTTDHELFGELANEPTTYTHELDVEILGVKVFDNESHVNKEYDIAVLSCSEPNLKYRRRPPLEPDKLPEDPLFEWVCTEGYVCDDWLIVPLKDFNFENIDQTGFFDPVTFEPYYPTGQYDEDGDPYVLPPYSVLNEPISNGVDVGGKEPMAIDPCNLYSFIEYAVKIYDAYKTRFQASNPIDTVSRVLNMLFEQVQKLVSEWDETKNYTPDELWRIYRFIRWMALGVTNRFYRVKVEYTYGDFVEHFDVYPFSPLIQTQGTVRKNVSGYGWVLEGHPIIDTMQNSATFEFSLPKKTRSSTISFELGNVVPDRPDEIVEGGVLFQEDFEGLPTEFNIRGDGWVPVPTQSGTGLGVEHPARMKTYRTNVFNVPSNAINPKVRFNYGIDTNMDTRLQLKKADGTVVWQSSGVVLYGVAEINPIAAGDYYFEVRVPQSESNNMAYINFTAEQINTEWKKLGYITEWRVEGDVIYEEENTPGIAMVVNPQWMEDSEYELEVEFRTEDIPANYGLIDWIGVVLNYRDERNYYLFGTWSDLDKGAKGGLFKITNGSYEGNPNQPKWEINPDFRFRLSHWHKLRAVVNKNKFTIYIDGTKYLDITDPTGWGFGASGLAAFSNPMSSFRNFKYKGKPRFDAFIDNVVVSSPTMYVPVRKPKYAIDFYLDNDSVPRIRDYLEETKRAFSFPILEGEHNAKWVFKKIGNDRSISQDASFVDNIVVRGMKVVGAEVVEEFIGCGGHMAVKILIENLLEYYRRHHQACKGERNIWIIE